MSSSVPRRPRRRALSVAVTLLLTAVSFVAISLATITPAAASHYRANTLTWEAGATPNSVDFHATGSWRCDYFAPCAYAVGDPLYTASMAPGDGGFLSVPFKVTSVDQANNVVSAEAHASYTYAGPGPWVASFDDCCRLSTSDGHLNNGDGGIRYETLVDLTRDTASPVGLVAPIVDCALDSVCSFTVPAVDPNGQGLNWRLSTSDEAGGFTQPAGASINATTGLYSWNTTGAQLAASGSTFYSTQVMIENVVGGQVVSRSAVDFFIRLGSGSTNAQPAFQAPTPADGSVLNGTVGQPLTFNVSATDPDPGDTVTPAVLGLPAGATFMPTPGNPATGTFTWTPTAAGDSILTLTAQDQNGLGAVPRGLTLNIEQPTGPAPLVVAAGADVSGTEGSAVALDGSVSGGSGSASTTWTATAGAGVDAGASCKFADANAVDTTVTCTDDGIWTLTLNGSEPGSVVVSDTAQLTVQNADPSVSITAPGASTPVDTSVSLTAPFTDAGANDTQTCAIDWGDGTTEPGTVGASGCTGTHTYTAAGSVSIKVTVTDDDAGVGSTTHALTVTAATPAVGKVWGYGSFKCPGKAFFALAVKPFEDGFKGFFTLKGTHGLRFRSTKITGFAVDGRDATVTGYGTMRGKRGYTFKVSVSDRSAKGSRARDRIYVVIKDHHGRTVFKRYASLHSGNIRVIS